MHSSEGAVSEGGDSLDSLSLQDFQGSASEEEKKEEGAASGEEKEYTIRDALAMMEKKTGPSWQKCKQTWTENGQHGNTDR